MASVHHFRWTSIWANPLLLRSLALRLSPQSLFDGRPLKGLGPIPMNRKQLAVVTAVVAAVVAVVAVVGVVTKTIPTFCDTLVVEGVFTFTALLCGWCPYYSCQKA